jgi:predicted transcriptional regulator
MGKSVRPAILAHLDQDKLQRLDELSGMTKIPRAVLIREAVDDLLKKHRAVWRNRNKRRPAAVMRRRDAYHNRTCRCGHGYQQLYCRVP